MENSIAYFIQFKSPIHSFIHKCWTLPIIYFWAKGCRGHNVAERSQSLGEPDV